MKLGLVQYSILSDYQTRHRNVEISRSLNENLSNQNSLSIFRNYGLNTLNKDSKIGNMKKTKENVQFANKN